MTIVKGKILTSKERDSRFNKRHPERRRSLTNDHRRRKRLAAITILGGICCICGFDDFRALQIDHINGGGIKEIRKVNGTVYINNVIKSVLNEENKYQLLCANCNWIKRDTNKEAIGRPIKNKIIIKT